jgi:hypothetical protein
LNASPIFVYDDTAQFTVQEAKRRQSEIDGATESSNEKDFAGNNPIFMGHVDEIEFEAVDDSSSKVSEAVPATIEAEDDGSSQHRHGGAPPTQVDDAQFAEYGESDDSSFSMPNPMLNGESNRPVDASSLPSMGDNDEDDSHFQEVFDAFDRAGLSEEQANTIMDLMTATDENGYIDKYAIMEVAAGWDHFQQFFSVDAKGNKSDKAARQMWTDLDTDKDGSVSFEEFKIGMQKLLGPICPKQALLRESYDGVLDSFEKEKEEENNIYLRYGRSSRLSIINQRSDVPEEEHVYKIQYTDGADEAVLSIEKTDTDGDELFWQVQVQNPTGSLERVPGDGMLIWFEDGTHVDLQRDDKCCECLKAEERRPHISLWEESQDNIRSHNHKLNGEEIRHFLSLEQRRSYAQRLCGMPGEDLPTVDDPLFIPSTCCVLEFSTPRLTGAHFVLNACYTGETPMLFDASRTKRIFRWFCNLIQVGNLVAQFDSCRCTSF